MRAGAILRELAAAYLIITLMATSLAKLRRWRTSSIAVAREQVIPTSLTPVAVIAVSLAEFSLATLLMLQIAPMATDSVIAGMFIVFGGYRLAVAAKTRSLMCACAGTTHSQPLTPQTITATIVTSLCQAGLACALMLTHQPAGASRLSLVGAACWAAPCAVMLVAALSRQCRKIATLVKA